MLRPASVTVDRTGTAGILDAGSAEGAKSLPSMGSAVPPRTDGASQEAVEADPMKRREPTPEFLCGQRHPDLQ